ncbi:MULTISPECIES: methylmalonyl-CoA mutase subunit beta [unclassified Mesorhizobium]|uniref:methylmalonyl-CoA mutase subunit beta n=1 Tax=unclassified Mesorhizobium TaxID=325217 RepID=UPI00112A7F1F|nr:MULTISPECIES: methylmalonyl-CoA mutase subunit beta [unclassified Mesorhizobium]MBZ9894978.1 methylmalonyl-CoA mutase subunit beta [Mesorhizobium sp. BR1-1-6]TPK60385.1 methylmalonyl-CoA mutase [Mesorhizobium sp. B2-5-1]TPM65203.1 methylmalonyl-CoA mutase [Mesorhizobium sp. B2-1-9]TPM84103.1 methylmalonyl-CoA mutase [Mesorhizobium sp. B2-1-4]TPN14211.1 methylmalonyl-CoA mutase [Mesorhizobium sp. B2-1-2]
MSAGALTRDNEVPNADRQRWLALAEKALAGASFEEKLISHTDDGIRVEPLYERAAAAEPIVRANPGSPWIVSQRIDDPDIGRAKAQALEDVAQGATGLSLVFEGAPNAFGYGLPRTAQALETVLDGIPLNRIQIRIDAHPWSRPMADWLVAFLGKRRSDPAKLNLSFGIDPAAILAGTGRLRMSIEALQESMPQSLAHFFSMGVPGVLLEADGRVFHNAGATEAQELGIMLASAVSYLRMFEKARQPLVYAAPHIGFALSADQDQFLSMAKVRALRRLWARVQEACSIPTSTANIHAETSFRMMTALDPETNILRTTIACFAAAAGGADSIAILPHTVAHGLPAPFARRVARNAQLIMGNESHIDQVADPACGSGGVEALTAGLCEAAWSELQAIEAEGGVLSSLQDGRIQERVRTAAAQRAAAFRSRERAIVGATLYPQKTERAVETLAAERRSAFTEGIVMCEPLFPVRIDQAIGAAS